MEKTAEREQIFRVWVDSDHRIVSFHEQSGAKLLEFRNRDTFLRCVDDYTARQYRYQ